MATVGVSNLSDTQSRLSYEREVSNIRSFLVQARNQSLTSKSTFSAKFDLQANLLSIKKVKGNSKKDNFSYKLPAGLKFVQATGQQINNKKFVELFFFSDGQSSGGSIKIVSATLSKLIKVEWLGGSVKIID